MKKQFAFKTNVHQMDHIEDYTKYTGMDAVIVFYKAAEVDIEIASLKAEIARMSGEPYKTVVIE